MKLQESKKTEQLSKEQQNILELTNMLANKEINRKNWQTLLVNLGVSIIFYVKRTVPKALYKDLPSFLAHILNLKLSNRNNSPTKQSVEPEDPRIQEKYQQSVEQENSGSTEQRTRNPRNFGNF